MADIKAGVEIVFRIPRDKVKHAQGCGLDFGGSLMKVGYAQDAGDEVELHLVSHSYASVPRVMQLLTGICSSMKQETTIDVHATGVGSGMMADQLKALFESSEGNVSYGHAPSEFQCFITAIRFLNSYLPMDQITFPKDEENYKKGREIGESNKNLRNVFTTGQKLEKCEETSQTNQLVYPFLLYMCGSAGVPIKVEADGTFQWLCHNYSGGKHFIGMGSVLAGNKTFEELMELAAKGDSMAVDFCGVHTKTPGKEQVLVIHDECRMYRSSSLVGKTMDDVKKEDLVASLLFSVTRLLAHDAFSWAHLVKTKQIIFVGSLIDHALIRDQMVMHMEERHGEIQQELMVDYHFMKNAGFLGSMGALLMGLKPT